MRKKQIGTAGRAQRRCRHILCWNSSLNELTAIGLHQIKKSPLGKIAVSGRPSGEEEQRVLFPDRVGFFGLTKQFGRVGKLGFELFAYFRTDLIAAAVNSRTNGCFDIARQRTEVAPHLPHSLLDDSLHCASPAGVEDAYRATFRIHQNDWQAVSGLNTQKKTRRAGDEAIAHELLLDWFGNTVNEIGMNLARRDQRPAILAVDGTELPQEYFAVALDRAAGIMFGEPQIESLSAIHPGEAAEPGAESVDQPWGPNEVRSTQDRRLRFPAVLG